LTEQEARALHEAEQLRQQLESCQVELARQQDRYDALTGDIRSHQQTATQSRKRADSLSEQVQFMSQVSISVFIWTFA